MYRSSGYVAGFGDFDVILKMLIVGFGEISSVVDASTFPAILSGLGYK
jgi:hypothetical protein